MTWVSDLVTGLSAAVNDAGAWTSIFEGLVLGVIAVALGLAIARLVGLLRADARIGETISVGLGSGLVLLAAWWAAVASGGRSAFTPVAIGLGVAIVAALLRRPAPVANGQGSPSGDDRPRTNGNARRRGYVRAGVAAVLFIVGAAFLYGATMAPSLQGGAQPLPFRDPAFYAVLARHLGQTGTESTIVAAGFARIDGLPPQMWYHWGELWLASAVSTITGTGALAARYYVVLPVLMLAVAGLAGTFVQRLTAPTRGTFLFGFVACLFLAPITIIWAPIVTPFPFIASVTVAMFHGIVTYGMAAVAALLAMYALTVGDMRWMAWPQAIFLGSVAAFLLPAHIATALLAIIGLGSVWVVHVTRALRRDRRVPPLSEGWGRVLVVAATALVATVGWGVVTGHGLPTGSPDVATTPFNGAWLRSLLVTIAGAGIFLAIPIAWVLDRRDAPRRADLYLGTMALVVAGAIGWGIRDGDFNMFYLFYAGIAVFATPVAAVAAWTIWVRLRAIGHVRLALAAAIICFAQLELGAGVALLRNQQDGPDQGPPVPAEIMSAIRGLPPDSRIAYACRPFEEATYGTPNLLGVTAYTGQAVVPMCFEADVFGYYAGAPRDERRPNGDRWAPQKALYPDAAADPSQAAIASFLEAHGIGYILASSQYPNTLEPGAAPIAESGSYRLLRVP